jgi:hypothetical protein
MPDFDFMQMYPLITITILYLLFIYILKIKTGNVLISDLGFIFSSFIFIYTIAPIINISIGIDSNDPISLLNPSEVDLNLAIWRQILYFLCFNLAYIFFRGSGKLTFKNYSSTNKDNKSILFLLGIILSSCLYLMYFSSEVHNYYEAYTRFDNLSWLLKKIASICIRLKMAAYAITLTFLYLNYKKLKYYIPIFIILSGTYEIFFSYGARVQFFIIIMQAIVLQSIIIKLVNFKKIVFIGILILLIITFIENVRLLDLNTIDGFSELPLIKAVRLPWELNAVFFPNLHLYMERAKNSIEALPILMFFSDFISIFSFASLTDFNPMEWYYHRYYPNAPVAPYTLGPIAESALWGGEIDLMVRGLINGIFFASITKWFVRRITNWSALVTYTFICATAPLTLKYSVFFDLSLIVKTLLPVLILVFIFRLCIKVGLQKRIDEKQ